MLAFHNDPELKSFVLQQLTLHREADKLVKREYWKDGKGCAVGCTLQAVSLRNGKEINHESHELYETELGIPTIIARLEDRFFECLPTEESQNWPERFTSAINPGADLELVWPKFAHWLLTAEVPAFAGPKSSEALAEVASLYKEWIDGDKPINERWVKARRKAYISADADLFTGLHYTAAYVAADAAHVVVDAVYAGHAVADAAYVAYVINDDNSYRRQADKLIELLKYVK